MWANSAAVVVILSTIFTAQVKGGTGGFFYGAAQSGTQFDRIHLSGAVESVNYWDECDGLAYNKDDNYLYGSYRDHAYILRIDPASGASSAMPIGGVCDGLAYDTVNKRLYGSTQTSILRIFPGNGATTTVNQVPIHFIGLAYNSTDGYLYGSHNSGNSISRISPTTGSILSTFSVGFNFSGLEYNSDDGYLYGTPFGSPSLYRISPSTGSASFVMDAYRPHDGLAYIPRAIPEPATLPLLLCGVCFWRRSAIGASSK